jgi:hypothetical protein
MKIFVIAGTYDEYRYWTRLDATRRWAQGETSITLSHYTYVSGPDTLLGHRNPHGVFYGTWRTRKDMQHIFHQLLVATDGVNSMKLNRIFTEWNQSYA